MSRRLTTLVALAYLCSAEAATPLGDAERAERLVAGRCVLCHGMRGEAVSPLYPKLAGQNAEYLVKQLFNFKTGQRVSSVMQPMAADLSAVEIDLLASYFSAQPLVAGRPEDPELAKVGRYIYFHGNRWSGMAPCASCHGADARGGAQMPRVAGQNAAYIEGRLRIGAQSSALPRTAIGLMHASIAPITELELRAVAQYLSGEN